MKGNKIILPIFAKGLQTPVGVVCVPYQYILDQTSFGYTKNESNLEVEFYAHDENCAIHFASEIEAPCSCDAILNYATEYQTWNGRAMPMVVATSLVEAHSLIEDTRYLVQRTNNIYFMK